MMFVERLEGRRLLSGGHLFALKPGINLAAATSLDFGLVNGRRQSAFATATDGTQFQFTLFGNGTGHAVADGDGFAVSLSGTTPRSALSIFTDNFGLITTLSTDSSIGSISAPDCSIGGDVSIAGTLGSAFLLGLSSEVGNTIHFDIAGAGVATNLQIALVSDVTLTAASPIRLLRVQRWADLNAEPDVINAPSIGQIRATAGTGVTGSFEADLNLTAVGGVSLGRMILAGGLNGSIIRATGSVGTVSVAAMHDSTIFAGVNPAVSGLPMSAGDFVASTSLGSFLVRNTTPAVFSDSVIAASSMGKVDVARVGTNAMSPTPFGVAAVSVRTYRRLTGGGGVIRRNVTQVGVFDSQGSYLAEILG
jgi:hypothetical protein